LAEDVWRERLGGVYKHCHDCFFVLGLIVFCLNCFGKSLWGTGGRSVLNLGCLRFGLKLKKRSWSKIQLLFGFKAEYFLVAHEKVD
jgi:hypothetical protein